MAQESENVADLLDRDHAKALLLMNAGKKVSRLLLRPKTMPSGSLGYELVYVMQGGQEVPANSNVNKQALLDLIKRWLSQPIKERSVSYEKQPTWLELATNPSAGEEAEAETEQQRQEFSKYNREQYLRKKYVRNPTEENAKALMEHIRKGSEMNRMALAKSLVRLASKMISARSFVLLRDVRTKRGAEFSAGTTLRVDHYVNKHPHYLIKLVDNSGQTLAVTPTGAHKYLRGFPKPPSMSTLEKWDEEGMSKAVDGSRVEPDGFSSDNAPSWLLVMGMI